MKTKHTLLIIEDEEAIRAGLTDVFLYHGYVVDTASDGPSGLHKALHGHYDLLLLDIMLPGMSGFEVCEHLRRQLPDLAIIMLTARTTDDDVITGLRLGADDYIAKPFSVTQLVLRVQAVLRRTKPAMPDRQSLQIAAGVTVDTLNLSGSIHGETISFTRREMETLLYLALHTERPVSREELLKMVWGYANENEIDTRTVDIHIARLRRKLEPDPKQPQWLVTVRGGGYRLLLAAPC